MEEKIMAKKISEDKQIKKLAKLMKDNVPVEDREIELFSQNGIPLVLVNKTDLYSVEFDPEQGHHYLLELTCQESVRKPVCDSRI